LGSRDFYFSANYNYRVFALLSQTKPDKAEGSESGSAMEESLATQRANAEPA
jgi:hypothetical protein